MPYSYLPPDELRKRIARTLYAEQHPERPDWIDEQLLRPGQVAALFQVSRRTISDWARAGKLDAIITRSLGEGERVNREFRPWMRIMGYTNVPTTGKCRRDGNRDQAGNGPTRR